MSAPFDTTLKELVDEFGADWVGWLAPALNLPAGVRATPCRAGARRHPKAGDDFGVLPPRLAVQ